MKVLGALQYKDYVPDLAEIRLDYVSATQVKVNPMPGTGGLLTVNGRILSVRDLNLTCSPSTNLITSTGSDAGSSMSVDTLYYAYVSNDLATYAPLSLRFSTQAPVTSGSLYTGYLGSSGNAANWRYVGMAYAWNNGGTPNFASDDYRALVVSHFNRIRKELRKAYDDTSHTYGTASWRVWNNSTSGRIHFITNYLVDFSGFIQFRGGVWVYLYCPASGHGYSFQFLNGNMLDLGCYWHNPASLGEYLRKYHSSMLPVSQPYNYADLYEYCNGTHTLYGQNTRNSIEIYV